MAEDDVPRWAVKFLRMICPEQLIEEIEGDLFQRFVVDRKRYGSRKAGRKFVWSVLRYFRPGILLRNNLSLNLTDFYMLTNYLKVALRVMFRNKTFTSLNVFGLALGITGALLLFLWIAQELSYDRFHTSGDRLYKAWNRATENGEIHCWDVTPRILAPTLRDEFSNVESAVSFAAWGSKQLFTVGKTRLLKTTGAYTDPDFLTMFSFPLLKGDPEKAFEGPSSIVLTERFARQLFGDREPFGETLTLGESGYSFEFKVTGVLKDLPSNTDFSFEYLIPFQFLESVGERDAYWGNNSVATYVKVREGTDLAALNNAIAGIERKHFAEGQHIEIFLYPLEKMRLYSRFENGEPVGGRIEIIRMLAILGACLIGIACINFINLSTARAQKRSKEVAIRKVTGALRKSLVVQFFCESILIALFSGLLSLVAAYLALPFFNTLVQQSLDLSSRNMVFWLGALGLIVLVGVLAGSYPALYLSSFKPVRILKGPAIVSAGKNTVRHLLVVFQFGFAVTMIVAAIVIHRQIELIQNREAGYERKDLIYLPLTGDLGKNYEAFRNDLLQSGVGISITKTSSPITERWSNTTGMEWRGKDPHDRTSIERMYVDEHFSTTAGLTILAGRDMDLQRYPSDSSAVLLNETALKTMGFENPVGEIIIDNGREWHVIGVVKDFVLTSPYQNVEPLVLLGSRVAWALQFAHIRLNAANPVRENLAKLSGFSMKYNPDYPVEFYFTDDEYQRKFANLEATLKITTVFTSIAIVIACLGLLGLSTYMIEARVKEIGIRKVFGGTVMSITKLLGLTSLKPILVAIGLFSPVAWLAMDWWLRSFAFRTSLDGWIFITAALVVLTIALFTIGAQTIRAAMANPVGSLRNE